MKQDLDSTTSLCLSNRPLKTASFTKEVPTSIIKFILFFKKV